MVVKKYGQNGGGFTSYLKSLVKSALAENSVENLTDIDGDDKAMLPPKVSRSVMTVVIVGKISRLGKLINIFVTKVFRCQIDFLPNKVRVVVVF